MDGAAGGEQLLSAGEAGRAVVIDPNDPRGPLERLEALGGRRNGSS
ncbi:MAG: hypothetical protein ACLRIS_16380 [Flavonifractor plautii]